MSKPKVSKIKIYKDYYIPLFTEGQLRKFIQDKLKDKIIVVYSCDGYNIAKAFDYDNEYKTKQDDLLYAYWKVACKIAQNIINEEKYINEKMKENCINNIHETVTKRP